MPSNKQEMIDKLRLEIQVIERGGYHPSVREPRKQPRIFRDSVSCLNHGLEEKREPCDHCYLMEFVPEEYRDEEMPCHHIPLNEVGDTVASLQSNPDRLQAELLGWLSRTVARLQRVARKGSA